MANPFPHEQFPSDKRSDIVCFCFHVVKDGPAYKNFNLKIRRTCLVADWSGVTSRLTNKLAQK
jgi:hypothetical protein